MAVPRMVQAELAFAVRHVFATVPGLDASKEDRAWHELQKALLYDLIGGTSPAIAAQMAQLAVRAKHEARAIVCDY